VGSGIGFCTNDFYIGGNSSVKVYLCLERTYVDHVQLVINQVGVKGTHTEISN